MVDPTERSNKLVNEVEEKFRHGIDAAEAMLPTYSRQAVKQTPEQQKQNYLMMKSTPGGFRQQLREWKEQFGLKRAVNMLLDWSRENEQV